MLILQSMPDIMEEVDDEPVAPLTHGEWAAVAWSPQSLATAARYKRHRELLTAAAQLSHAARESLMQLLWELGSPSLSHLYSRAMSMRVLDKWSQAPNLRTSGRKCVDILGSHTYGVANTKAVCSFLQVSLEEGVRFQRAHQLNDLATKRLVAQAVVLRYEVCARL